MTAIPHTAFSPTRGTAPLDFPELDAVLPDEPPPLPLPLPLAGAVGVNTADPLAKQAVAAAFAELMSEGAELLIVAFPEKLQDRGLRLLA